MPTSTSSIRIPDELRSRLERTARYLKKDKSWVIKQALEEYLRRVDREAFLAEALRQSLLVSEFEQRHPDRFCEEMVDTRGWK